MVRIKSFAAGSAKALSSTEQSALRGESAVNISLSAMRTGPAGRDESLRRGVGPGLG